MVLSARNVLPYLLDRKLITLEDLVDKRLEVFDTSRRNRSFFVSDRQQISLFVKQANDSPPPPFGVKNEGLFYEFSRDCEISCLPAFFDFSRNHEALVTEYVKNSTNYHEFAGTHGFVHKMGRPLGKAIAEYHTKLGHALRYSNAPVKFSRQLPWAFSFRQEFFATSKRRSIAQAKAIAMLQEFKSLNDHIEAQKAAWVPNSVIHGDLKFLNIVLLGQEIFIVDWEFSSIGDICWDLAGALHSYLCIWLFSMPLSAQEEDIQTSLATNRIQLEEIQKEIRAFWFGFAQSMSLQPAASRQLLLRSVQFCAVRLIQLAYESLAHSENLSPGSVFLFQMSMNIFEDTEKCIFEVFGLDI